MTKRMRKAIEKNMQQLEQDTKSVFETGCK
jgi:hypothetical protein